MRLEAAGLALRTVRRAQKTAQRDATPTRPRDRRFVFAVPAMPPPPSLGIAYRATLCLHKKTINLAALGPGPHAPFLRRVAVCVYPTASSHPRQISRDSRCGALWNGARLMAIYARILAKLEQLDNLKRGANPREWTARCPVDGHEHGDKKPSLHITERDDGAILLHCFLGHETPEIVQAMGASMADLFPPKTPHRRGEGGRKPPPRATGATDATAQPPPNPDEANAPSGCTLLQYAELKGLPIAFLRQQGLTDIPHYAGAPAVRIPYYGPDGRELLGVQFRTALHKSPDGPDLRFKWRKGDHAVPYGQWKLAEARERGYLILVEGASDCHTLWLQREPALGIPGASAWDDARDAPLLDGIPTIYVIIEPDTGGAAVRKWLATSRIRERVRLVHPSQEFKDPSAIHLSCKADHQAFMQAWRSLLDAAVCWEDVEAETSRATAAGAWERCADLATQDDILAAFYTALAARGVAGEQRAAKLLYLAQTSRLFDRPVSVIVKAPSSTGKSYVAERVAEFFLSESYILWSAMSERALVYGDDVLAHRFLIIPEASGLEGGMRSYIVRTLLSEGRLIYATTEKTAEGLVGRTIEKPGPTGLIVGTTALSLHAENETRHLSLPVTDTPKQTTDVMLATAEAHDREPIPDAFAPWHALQTWLASTSARVTIPYARALALLIPPVAVRLRRDFKTLLVLIQSHAFLHQRHREQDARGWIIATLDDYAVVRELVADLIAQGVEKSVSVTTRQTVAAVNELVAAPEHNGAGVSITALAAYLNLDKSVVSRRVKTALARDFLRNLEERQRQPARLVVGVDMPDDVEVLPTVAQVCDYRPVAPVASVALGEDLRPPSPPPTNGHLNGHAHPPQTFADRRRRELVSEGKTVAEADSIIAQELAAKRTGGVA